MCSREQAQNRHKSRHTGTSVKSWDRTMQQNPAGSARYARLLLRVSTAFLGAWLAQECFSTSAPAVPRSLTRCNARERSRGRVCTLGGGLGNALYDTTTLVDLLVRPPCALFNIEHPIFCLNSRLGDDGVRRSAAACHGMLPCRKGKLLAWTPSLASDDNSPHARAQSLAVPLSHVDTFNALLNQRVLY